jgi:hypothetical protein
MEAIEDFERALYSFYRLSEPLAENLEPNVV